MRPGGGLERPTSSTAASSARTSTPLVQGGDPEAEALGRSQGGFSTKVHRFYTDGVLFSGDTLFQGSIGKFDGNGGSFEQIMSRLMPLPEETIVRPGHMDQTTNGFERRNNPFVQQILEAMRSR
jgi:hypothetical protein